MTDSENNQSRRSERMRNHDPDRGYMDIPEKMTNRNIRMDRMVEYMQERCNYYPFSYSFFNFNNLNLYYFSNKGICVNRLRQEQ